MKAEITLEKLLSDLDGGILDAQIVQGLKDACDGVVYTGKKGEVIIKLKLSRISDSRQINIESKLEVKTPKPKGHIVEVNESENQIYLDLKGNFAASPAYQIDIEQVLNK